MTTAAISLDLGETSEALSNLTGQRLTKELLVESLVRLIPIAERKDMKNVKKIISKRSKVSKEHVRRTINQIRCICKNPLLKPSGVTSNDQPPVNDSKMDVDAPASVSLDEYHNMACDSRFCGICNFMIAPPNEVQVNVVMAQNPIQQRQNVNPRNNRRRANLQAYRQHPHLRQADIDLIDFLLVHAPVRSGSMGIHVLVDALWVDAYRRYLEWIIANRPGHRQMGRNRFVRVCREFRIRRFHHDRYACPLCANHNVNGPPENNEQYENHRFACQQMREAYLRDIQNLDPTVAVAIMDYSRFHEISARSCESHIPKKNGDGNTAKTEKTSMLNFSILTKDVNFTDSAPNIYYIDVFGQVKQGRSFLEVAVEKLHDYLKKNMPELKTIHFWADGGLKNIGSICALTNLSTAYSVTLNHYASYHGHNPCDAHFSAVKRGLRNGTKNGMLDYSQLYEVLPTLKNTEFHEIPSNTPPIFTHMPANDFKVKSYHSFSLQHSTDGFSVLAHPFERTNSTISHSINHDALSDPPAKREKPSKKQSSVSKPRRISKEDADNESDGSLYFSDHDSDFENELVEEDLDKLDELESFGDIFDIFAPPVHKTSRRRQKQITAEEIVDIVFESSDYENIRGLLHTNISNSAVVNSFVSTLRSGKAAIASKSQTTANIKDALVLLLKDDLPSSN